MAFLKEKFQLLQQEIYRSCKKSGRNPDDIRILAATKYADRDAMNDAVRCGIQYIGENRIQDAKKKFSELLPVKRFFIGHLQTNKVKTAIKLFDGIEAVDSVRLAKAIAHESAKEKKVMPLLLEVNVARDPKKFGFNFDDLPEALLQMKFLKDIQICGLMTIVPFFDDPEKARPYFKKMKQLFDTLRKKYPSFDILSMGMSHDFCIAIEEGSTEIRIGSYLFQ